MIAAANESDLYTFTVAAAGLYTIETQGGTDTILTLFGPDSQTLFIAEDDDSGVRYGSGITTNLRPIIIGTVRRLSYERHRCLRASV